MRHEIFAFVLLYAVSGVFSSHFRGGIIMVRPQAGGAPKEVEISYRISWRRSRVSHSCDSATITSGHLIRGEGSLTCQYGCSGTITPMSYICTDFSIAEDWTFGERILTYDISASINDIVAVGFTGNAWISPFSGRWNISTTFSTIIRNDTGQINSSPRALTAPVIRIQEGCNHTIALSVTDPDEDIIRCRWAVGRECAGICNGFPGAELDPHTCTIRYEANRGARLWAAAIMIEDFIPESTHPLSSVALQFLVLVVPSTESCSRSPEFIQPTLDQGSCIAVPPGGIFETQVIAVSGGRGVSITEIQTVSPLGTRRGELQYMAESSAYYVNITWTPTVDQYNQTHLLCFTAINSVGLASEQICIQLLSGYLPPVPIQVSAMPDCDVVHPSNTTWKISFDRGIQRPSASSFITFHEFTTEVVVYKIDVFLSQEVKYTNSNVMVVTPKYAFPEKKLFYVNFDRKVVQGLLGCGPGNEPVKDKFFWRFETMDITPPMITYLENPSLSNSNISLSWTSNENVNWSCILSKEDIETIENCSDAIWTGYDLDEGIYKLYINAIDDAGNVARVVHTFEIDLTPPTAIIIRNPRKISNLLISTFEFSCSEVGCSYECILNFISNNMPEEIIDKYQCIVGNIFYTPTLQHNNSYTFSVTATDQVGNKGEPTKYEWMTDFDAPHIFGVKNLSILCSDTNPELTGKAQAMDNTSAVVSITYRDVEFGCLIKRNWMAMDEASNTAHLIQNIDLEFSPTVSLSPAVAFPCESISGSIQVPSNTASAPNPCALPLQLTYMDSIHNYTCPSNFVRNWTVSSCGNSASFLQNVSLFDLCPPHACGRNESTPRGVCSLGKCQCNRPWYGDQCNVLIYAPVPNPVNNSILQEAQPYITTITLVQGTPPLSWVLVSGPNQLRVNQYTGQVIWSRAQAGNHTVIVQIANQVGRAEVFWVLQVKIGYTTFLTPISPPMYPQAQPIALSGYVEYVDGNLVEAFLAGIVPVYIDITSNGTTRTLITFTKQDGTFSVAFHPTPTEYGAYTAGSRHPGLLHSLPQTEWGFLGMTSVPTTISLSGEAVSEFEKTFYNATIVCNNGPGTLSRITATPVLSNTRYINVQIVLRGSISNTSLEPGDKVAMDIFLTASRPVSEVFPITVKTSQGTTLQLYVSVRIDPILPNFLISPPSVNTRIVRGTSRVFEFDVINTGRTIASDVRSLLPNTNIISFVSFGSLQQSEGGLNLGKGESAILSILTQTPGHQQLGEFKASIIVASQEISASIPFTLIVSSDALMNLTVIVEDEYTYFAAGQPLVDNAAITLVNYQRGIRLTQNTFGDNGTTTFVNIYEDRYEMIVEALDHLTLHQVIITSGDNSVISVFVQRQTVTYTWSVTPVTYQDTYVLVVEADFVTNVPIPIVTVTPAEVDLEELELGFITSFQVNITNHGLIRADNVGLDFPNNHPFLEFSTSNSELGNLEALSSVTIPVQVSRRSIQKRNVIWVIYVINIVYSYVCGDRQFRTIPVVMKKPEIIGTPIMNRISCFGCGGFGGFGGGGGFSFTGYTARTPAFCNSCIQSLLSCAPTPNFPFAGCIPELARTDTNGIFEAIEVLLQCDSSPTITIGQSRTPIFTRQRGRRSLPIGIDFEGRPFLTSLLGCLCDVYDNCLAPESNNRQKRNLRESVTNLVEAMYPIHLSIALGVEVLGDEIWIPVSDPRWLSTVLRPTLDDASEAGTLISSTELLNILSAPLPNGTTMAIVTGMVQRLNNTLYGWNNGQLEPSEGLDMASFSVVQELTQTIHAYNDRARGKGFSSYIDAYNFASDEINHIDNWEEEAGVCAVVRIRIEQELAITREAFLARLEIENQESSSLLQIEVEILITDSGTGQDATHLFAIGNGSLSGSLHDTSREWRLSSESTGSVEWLIIPYSEAAPESDQSYDVGGILRYSLEDEIITIPLLPTVITVRPDPSLLVHYFWEMFVVGDDPFTDEIEPSVPFTLGVAVKNAGHGTAYSLQITSGQPEIIDNERGLLVNFMIIDATIGSGSISPSLTVMFGDLAPATTIVARWLIVSSLKGEFMNYSATFENINPRGDPRLSILDELEIHELIRNVKIYSDPNEDDVLDFLVNDKSDLEAYPDALYSSKSLERYSVSVGTVLSVRFNSDRTTILEVVTVSNATGWVYYRYEDTQGFLSGTAASINGTKREGNKIFPIPAENSWITRVKNSQMDTETFHLHIFDMIEVTEEVTFFMNVCVLKCQGVEMPFIQPTTKIPTPSITIFKNASIFYAGSKAPLTLICNITIDSAFADFTNVSVNWYRGTTLLVSATDRVTISPLSGSGTRTSVLTLTPPIIEDSATFTCKANAIPFIELASVNASDVGEGSIDILVQRPLPPTVSILKPSNSIIAGEPFNMTCIVMIPHELLHEPILRWSGPGANQNTTLLNKYSQILIFDSIHTSQAGVYECTSNFNIPVAGINLTAMGMAEVNVRIPQPLLTVVGSPRDANFYQGLDLTFTCSAQLQSAVDTPVTVTATWMRNNTRLVEDNDSYVTLTDVAVASILPQTYLTTVRLNPMDFDDAGTFTCIVTVVPDNTSFINGTTASATKTVTTVLGFPRQRLNVTDEGTSIVKSSGYTLICTITREQDLSSMSTLTVQWLDPDGRIIDGDGFRVSGAQEPSSDVVLISKLTFLNLSTSQSGQYTCRSLLTIPGTSISNHPVHSSFSVEVNLPSTTLPPLPSPEVQGLCTVIIWYRPELPCESINGYTVRLFNPQVTHQSTIRHVGANSTFYIIKDEDRLDTMDSIHVQVRLLYSGEVGQWSEGVSLGCEKPTLVPVIPDIYFEINGEVYTNNSVIGLNDVGEGEQALLCKTNRVDCCSILPNRRGQFYYPNGIQVPISKQLHGFYRNRGTQVVRLNRRTGVTSPSGKYRCEIPNADGVMQNIYITLMH